MTTERTLPTTPPTAPRWMRPWLVVAGIYNLLWGGVVILAPRMLFEFAGLASWTESPGLLPIWQCLGMVIGVYGIGYLAASRDPLRHWPIVLVGLLGKVFGPIGFLFTAIEGSMPWSFGVTILFNDLPWLVPFALILLAARRAAMAKNPRTAP